MAKIPGIGDFGNLVPEARRTQTASAAQLDGGLSQAVQGVARTAGGIAENMIDERLTAERRAAAEQAAEAKREQEKQAARAERVQSLTAHAGIQTGVSRARMINAEGQASRIAGDNAATAGFLNAASTAMSAGYTGKKSGWR